MVQTYELKEISEGKIICINDKELIELILEEIL